MAKQLPPPGAKVRQLVMTDEEKAACQDLIRSMRKGQEDHDVQEDAPSGEADESALIEKIIGSAGRAGLEAAGYEIRKRAQD